ncbi:hypothetical protein C8J56DRAFT_1038739 [Mycena floridula]|nr:hypothetical protein C8J56DRAFT_1038739 [Mycena floridula]
MSMEPAAALALGQSLPKESNPTVFESYIREAKVFDDSMVDGWKVAMDGMILFAALFSAVITAFLIESYKTLSRDSTDVMIILLYQISQQLAANGNNSQVVPIQSPADIAFRPSRAAIITNAFWFLSLGLSLACALIATLIQQWAADYIHAIDRRQAPEKRARIRAFLFEGVENSNVGAIVEGTPVLLHASLFSFLIGLVVFMHPINTVITILLSVILATCGIAYISSTVLPLLFIASPIRTPLTMFLLEFPFLRNIIREGLQTLWELGYMAVSAVWRAMMASWTKIRAGISAIRTRIPSLPIISAAIVKLQDGWQNLPDQIGALLGLEKQEPDDEWGRPVHEQTLLRQLQWTVHRRLPRKGSIWISPLIASNLDTIRESVATNMEEPGFQERELHAIGWTLDSLSNDTELIPFLEGIPSFINFPLSATPLSYDPVKVMKSLVYAKKLAHQLMSPMPFDSSVANRGTAASIKAVVSLLEHDIYPASESDDWFALNYLRRSRPFCEIQDYRWLELVMITSWIRLPDLNYWEVPDMLAYVCSDCPEELKVLSLELSAQPWDWADSQRGREVAVYPGLMTIAKCWQTKVDNQEAGERMSRVLSRLFESLSFPATGTPLAQRAYALAMLHATRAMPRSPLKIVEFTDLFLRPLSQVTDPVAVEHVLTIFKLKIWWTDLWRVVNVLTDSPQLLGDLPLFSIYYTHQLMRKLLMVYSTIQLVFPDRANKVTLNEIDSGNQISISMIFERMAQSLGENVDLGTELLRIISTLNDPRAVAIAQRALEFFLPAAKGSGTVAQEAILTLNTLKETSKKPEFGLKALVLRDEPSESFPFNSEHDQAASS